MKSRTVAFCELLGTRFPALSTLLEDHRQGFGEILPHLFIADVLEYILLRAPSDEGCEMVQFIDNAFTGEPDRAEDLENDVNNLIAVSFIENISTAEDFERVVAGVNAEKLRQEWRRQQR